MLWGLGALFGVLMYYAYKNTHQLVFNRIKLPIQKTNSSLKDLHILHLSDLHMENISITPEQLYEQLKDEKIDLIALTGDYLDKPRNIPKLEKYLDVLQKLPVRYGMYAVFGNHDYLLPDKEFQRLKQTLAAKGCKVMQNEHHHIQIGSCRLNVIGIDDFCTRRSKPEQAFEGIEDGINLILTHDPNLVLHLDRHFDYLLSGHFHGGQIHWPRPYHLAKMGKLARMNIIRGLHFHKERAFYISEGLGQTGVNIRLRSRPEITLHTLVGNSDLSHKNVG
ncbi:MAG: metallophosphoesterase [Bacillaceae bacterium]|nr:metallophosphoesterase [Bacillaceae bacterium]